MNEPLKLSRAIRPVRLSAGIICLMAAINAAAAERDPALVELARKHYRKREKIIQRFKDTIDRHLNYAKAETLRKVEKHLSVQKDRHSNAGGVTNFVGSTVNSRLSVNAGGVAADFMFDLDVFAEGLFAALRNESADALQTAGDELFAELQRDDPWSMPDPLARKFLQDRQNLLRDVPNEMFQTIERTIEQGIAAGDSIREMSKRITTEFDEMSQGRATTIASTETGAAYGFARNEAMKKAGVQLKSWLTSHLPNVRPAHALAEKNPANQHVPLEDPFIVDGEELMYPGDVAGSPGNVINCHCIALAAKEAA